MASSSQNPKMSSNQLAAEELWNKKTEEAIVLGRTYLHYLWSCAKQVGAWSMLIDLMVNNPVEFDRLNELFTAIQWHESPDEVAKVISGESPVSKEIPDKLLTYLRAENTPPQDKVDFYYYLAYRAACLENHSKMDLSSILPEDHPFYNRNRV